jgi:phage N-6-adenine-methyltransferase
MTRKSPAAILAPRQDSVIRNPEVPTLAQLIREGEASAARIKRATKDALTEWFAQSERLNIARQHHGLRGDRFIDFAGRIGVDRASGYQLVKLWQHRAAILARCLDEGRYYGWETCLYWFERAPRKWNRTYPRSDARSDERRTPKSIFTRFGGNCTLDVAATDDNALCPAHFTKKQDALKQEWTGTVWMNPPYSDVLVWCAKAVEHARNGGVVIGLLPAWTDAKFFHDYCSLGHIRFLRNRLVFTGVEGAHAPFANIVVTWTQESVTRKRKAGATLDAVLDIGAPRPIRQNGHGL